MLGSQSMDSARVMLGGIEMVHMMRKTAGDLYPRSSADTG